MKRRFGNIFTRALWGGTSLTPVEHQLLELLIAELPEGIRVIAERQLDASNLVQREVDGRALNFYRKAKGQSNSMDGLPLLDHTVEEAPLIRVTAHAAGLTRPIHAVLTAVRGRVFCMSLSESVAELSSVESLKVQRVEQSWRSNVRLHGSDA